jgi:flagellar motor switch protein FliN/FliY
VVLGSEKMPFAHLMKLQRGAVVALDQRVGDQVNVVVNGRVVARSWWWMKINRASACR